METERIPQHVQLQGSNGGSGEPERIPAFKSIAPAPRDLETITSIQSSLIFPRFNSDDAFALGCLLRTRLVPNPLPLIIAILSPSGTAVPRTLFYTATHPGTSPDNDSWVQRKAATVFRFGIPTWAMHVKFAGDEKAFKEKYGLGNGADDGGRYAIHGGGVPIRVRGVEGIVAVVVVSGLKQEEDHAVVVEVLKGYLGQLGESGGTREKD